MQSFYRYRSVDALLGDRQELEQQQIYFASPEQLNDPIEGFKDLYWFGDEIVWRNLLKHYLLCLHRAYVVTKISGQDFRPTLDREDPVIARIALPTAQIRDIYNRICVRFFDSYGISELPALLAKCQYRLGRDALEFCLAAIHQPALNAVLQIYGEAGLEPAADEIVNDFAASTKEVVDSMKFAVSRMAVADDNVSADDLGIAFAVGRHMAKQLELIAHLTNEDEHFHSRLALFAPFPEWYVNQLRHFIFFKWYAACFVVDPNDGAMWGNYGDSHKGVCLKFHADDRNDGTATLSLHGMIGASGNAQGVRPTYGDRPVVFQAVKYVERLEQIDFFRSLARVPIPDLKSDWYMDDSGDYSNCSNGALITPDVWRKNIWEAFDLLTTTKLLDWKHEREYRLVLTSGLDMYSDVTDRKLRYKFSDLEGIIFGIKTSLAEKEAIVKIIRAKCKKEGRQTFTFSQATYMPHSGKIITLAMDLLRVD